jgi:hypothetical protein
MADYVARAIAGDDQLTTPAETIFLLYLPDGVSYVDHDGNVNCGCSVLRGAHAWPTVVSPEQPLAFVQRCPSSTPLDSATFVASHEVIEALTDPTGKGFTIPHAGGTARFETTPFASLSDDEIEVGDLCSSTRYRENGSLYTRVWSTSAAAAGIDPCVPALSPPDAPYYAVSGSGSEWAGVSPGGTVDVALVAWSTAPMEDWYVYPYALRGSGGRGDNGFVASMSGDTPHVLDGTTYFSVRNGSHVYLHVTAPKTVSAGDWELIDVWSLLAVSRGDRAHFWPVGIYVK